MSARDENTTDTQNGINVVHTCNTDRDTASDKKKHVEKSKKSASNNNRVRTSKYTLLTFLPKNLYEQFRRVANVYFLLIACFQLIPGLSPVNSYTTIVPLTFVLSVTAVKEAIEDYKRHKGDNKVNNKHVEIVCNGGMENVKWKDLVVGDIVRVVNGKSFPADLVLLSGSEEGGLCYVETSSLDGETNLKLRHSLAETSNMTDATSLSNLHATVEAEQPNNSIHAFNGSLTIHNSTNTASTSQSKPHAQSGTKIPLSAKNILLRGCVLRYTEFVYGIVVYAGDQTKQMQNSTEAPSKMSSLERRMNRALITMFVFMVLLCALSAAAGSWWDSVFWPQVWYLRLDADSQWRALLNVFTFIITFSLMIPISLYVSLEVVRVVQALLIDWDMKMYDEESDTPAKARTSNLSEELGQVSYVFADKTGTLTRNQMEFVVCAVGDTAYSVRKGEDKDVLSALKAGERQGGEGQGDSSGAQLREFFTALAVCHTVIIEPSSGEYQAASPDEGALITAVRRVGFTFCERNADHITIQIDGQEIQYELLNILEFNSDRKRVSVIVRTAEGKIKLYCKGADSAIFERLSSQQESNVQEAQQYLEKFATEGLRTLCVSMLDIEDEKYATWDKAYQDASAIQDPIERDKKVDEVAEEIEKDMKFLGVTGIEDKLQDGVPKTIKLLREANIHVWVLTGDKRETAINIGFSCKLLTPDMDIVSLSKQSVEEVGEELREALGAAEKEGEGENKEAAATESGRPRAMVIEGTTLTHALAEPNEKLLLQLAGLCSSVLCVRATPLQKAELVRFIRKNLNVVTLAIGDGANDTSMIREAHVGVGISGVEGNQAMMASDYTIAQFQYLYRLLLVHGRWDYIRNSKLVTYSFYKNMVFALTQLWFGIFNGFSAQTLYDGWTISIFNVVFSGLPILSVSIFDQDVPAEAVLKNPKLYSTGQQDRHFKVRLLWGWLISFILPRHYLFPFFPTS